MSVPFQTNVDLKIFQQRVIHYTCAKDFSFPQAKSAFPGGVRNIKNHSFEIDKSQLSYVCCRV